MHIVYFQATILLLDCVLLKTMILLLMRKDVKKVFQAAGNCLSHPNMSEEESLSHAQGWTRIVFVKYEASHYSPDKIVYSCWRILKWKWKSLDHEDEKFGEYKSFMWQEKLLNILMNLKTTIEICNSFLRLDILTTLMLRLKIVVK